MHNISNFNLLTFLKGFEYLCLLLIFSPTVRDRLRTKKERDILVDVQHPFIVKLHYGECNYNLFCFIETNMHFTLIEVKRVLRILNPLLSR